MRWPSTKTIPADTDPPVKWALWYRDVCGLIVLPTRGPEDVKGFSAFLARQAVRSFVERKSRQPDTEERAKIESEAREEAERTAKGPMQPWRDRAFVTDTEIRAWWGDARGQERGIWIPMGRIDAKSLAAKVATPIMGIDVDPRSGGVTAEWDSGSGPMASTPSGGAHLIHLHDPAFATSTGDQYGRGLAPGIDVRASGGGLVVPSGSSSPGRSWARWEAPTPATAKMTTANAEAKDRPHTPGESGRSGVDGSSRVASTFAEILATTAPDGTRNATAAQIIGVLARPQAIPEDSLEAALAMLFEAGEDDMEAWERLLTRGPRTPEDAVAFLAAWNSTRGDPPWSDGRCERTARSLWKTADRREGGNAGAEDLGYVEPWDASGVPEGASIDEQEQPQEDATDEAPKVIEFKPPAFQIPAGFADSLSVALPFSSLLEMTKIVPITVEHGPKWRTWDLKEDTSAEYGYGMGPWFNAAVGGGINPSGAFWAWGGLMPKIGKTNLIAFMLEGLAMLSAQRLVTGEDGWVTPIFWLTEMVKHVDVGTRQIGRYLGIDTGVWSRGTFAHEAPGILNLAVQMKCSPEDAWKYMLKVTGKIVDDGDRIFCTARDLTTNLDPQALPRKRGGRHAENPRLGLSLLDMVEKVVTIRVAELAERWQIDPARIKPIIVADPVHRFIDAAGEDKLTAINLVIGRLREMAYERKWIVMATSDTTKGGSGADKDMGGDVGVLANNAFAGSINLAHEPDTVIAIRAGAPIIVGSGGVAKRDVEVRVCYSRRGGQDTVLPFEWQTWNGRYFPQDPALLESKSQEPIVVKDDKPAKTWKPRGRPRKHS